MNLQQICAASIKKADSDSDEEDQNDLPKEKGVSNKKKKICSRPDVVSKSNLSNFLISLLLQELRKFDRANIILTASYECLYGYWQNQHGYKVFQALLILKSAATIRK